jgi:branched-chain amino acid transport system substrate-binding protein
VAEELRVLTILADCGTDRVFEERKYRYVFRTHAHTVIDGVGAARYLITVKPDVKTIAGINQDYAWGRDSWDVFSRALRKLKPDVQVIDTLWPKLFAGEYSAEISKLLVDGADVVFTSFWGGDLVTFSRQAKARGLTEQGLVLVNNTGADIKDLAPGIVIGSRGPHGIVSEALEKHPLRVEFIELYRQRFGLAPNHYISHGAYHYLQALQGIGAAYDRAGRAAGRWPTLDQVLSAFERLEFDSPSGRITLAIGDGHQAVEPAAYAVLAYDPKLGVNTFTQVRMFQARCVNPPDGMKSLEWIDRGFPGAECP